MIEQAGLVLRNEGEDAWVRVGGQAGCRACDAGQGCGAGLFGRLLRRADTEVRVTNPERIEPGQQVMLGIEERDYLALVMRLYGWPLLLGLAGAWAGHVLAEGVYGAAAWQTDLAAGGSALVLAGTLLYWQKKHLAQAFTRLSLRMLKTTVQLDCQASGRNNASGT